MSDSNLEVSKMNRANEMSETRFGIVWHFKYCVICNNRWNTCRNNWSIFNFNIYRNDCCS